MATYKQEIENLVGSVGDDDLITEACTRVAHQVVAIIDTKYLWGFSTTTSELTSNGYETGSTSILEVVRETGTNGEYRSCDEILMDMEQRVQDVNSIHYADKFNPVFIRKDSNIYVYPAPAVSPNSFKVTYASAPSIAHDDTAFGKASILNELELCIIYGASHQCLLRLLSEAITTDLPSDITLGDFPTPPIYTSWGEDLGEVTSTDTGTLTHPTFDNPNFVPVLSSLNDALTDEDPELASSHLSKLQFQLSEYEKRYNAELSEYEEEKFKYEKDFEIIKLNREVEFGRKDKEKQNEIAIYDKKVQEYTETHTKEFENFQKKLDKITKKVEVRVGLVEQMRQSYEASLKPYLPEELRDGNRERA